MNSKNIYQRLAEVMEAVKYVQKEDKRVNNQYRYVSHDAVVAAVRPAMVAAGIVCSASLVEYKTDVIITKTKSGDNEKETATSMVQSVYDVSFINIDNPADRHTVRALGFGIDTQDKGPGKACSYSVKYAVIKTLFLETGDDPERDLIDHVPRPNPVVIPQPKKQLVQKYTAGAAEPPSQEAVIWAKEQIDPDYGRPLGEYLRDCKTPLEGMDTIRSRKSTFPAEDKKLQRAGEILFAHYKHTHFNTQPKTEEIKS